MDALRGSTEEFRKVNFPARRCQEERFSGTTSQRSPKRASSAPFPESAVRVISPDADKPRTNYNDISRSASAETFVSRSAIVRRALAIEWCPPTAARRSSTLISVVHTRVYTCRNGDKRDGTSPLFSATTGARHARLIVGKHGAVLNTPQTRRREIFHFSVVLRGRTAIDGCVQRQPDVLEISATLKMKN